ncbi:MAG: 5'-deoxynucleotidase [Oscillospiraceae bacterium]|jgi:5'-deoxynucleotidase|nr:5'-deoxynucleotidase [Oscillospiraceae bacterium]
MYKFFAYISRMKYINRWSLMRSSVPENIQEHSHMAAVLAHALGVIRRDVFGRPCDPDACAAAALFHDATEIFTGDLPTPIKYYSPAIREAYHQVEEVAADKLLGMLPGELRGAYEPLLREADPEIRRIVKAADKLSAYIKCLEELEAGNNEFGDAAGETLEALRRMELEEVTWFLEHFAEAFGLTLDGLQRGQGGP